MYLPNPLKALAVILSVNSLLVEASPITARAPDRAPTVAECKDQLDVPAGGTLFWSKLGGPAKKAAKERDYLAGYKVMDQMWKDPSWKNQFTGKDEKIDGDFWNHCSQALAEASSGRAYLFLKEGSGTDWDKNSHWNNWEWPFVKDPNSAITELIRISPSDPNHKEWIIGDPPAGPADPAPPSPEPADPAAPPPPPGPPGPPGRR